MLGGLGNQLFQYATGRRLAELNGARLKLDLTAFDAYQLHSYALHHFNIRAEIATRNELRIFQAIRRSKVLRAIASAPPPALGKSAYVREESLRYNERVQLIRGSIYLDGYWQSEMYFEPIRDQLRRELTVKTPPDAANRRVASAIKDGPSASIHVRLGDYLSDPLTRRTHGLVPAAYYEKAVARILTVDPDVRFFLFSDNPKEALKRIPLSASTVESVAINDATRNFEDLRLMNLTKHHIIANSSFSWWGAWLSEGSGITIAPQTWFADESLESSDVVPSDWITL